MFKNWHAAVMLVNERNFWPSVKLCGSGWDSSNVNCIGRGLAYPPEPLPPFPRLPSAALVVAAVVVVGRAIWPPALPLPRPSNNEGADAVVGFGGDDGTLGRFAFGDVDDGNDEGPAPLFSAGRSADTVDGAAKPRSVGGSAWVADSAACCFELLLESRDRLLEYVPSFGFHCCPTSLTYHPLHGLK